MAFIGAYFMTMACALNSNTSLSILHLILYVLFFWLYKKGEAQKKNLCCIIPAAFFACCMLLGASYYSDNSWDLVFGSRTQIIKSACSFLGHFLLFRSLISCLFCYADKVDLRARETKSPFTGVLRKAPFRTAFLTLFLAYLPYMIYSFPGIFSTDTRVQLQNGYAALAGLADLKNHHPVVHTLLLRLGTWLGETLFSSANAGLFLVSLAQSALLFAAIAWLVRLLVEKNVSERAIWLMLLFYAVSPRIRNYVFLLVKDTWFAPFLLIYIVQLYRLLTWKSGSRKSRRLHMGLLIVSMLGIFFFRQDGVYLLLLSGLAILLACRENRKLTACLLTGTLAFSFLYSQVLLPAFDVTPTNPREMLSVPFQQTARYIRDAGDEVTEEEREAIAAILDYDSLAEAYNPNLSDPVKATYNKEAGGEYLAAYFKVWFQMFLKHPDIYVQATMNNLYGYFYPDGYTTKLYSYEESAEKMEKLNEDLEAFGTDFGYPETFRTLRNGLETLRETLFRLPVLSALNLSAFYIWLLLLWSFYCLRGRGQSRRDRLLITWPLLIVLLICMAGPAYGWYFRYMYSIVICLPAVILLGWSEKET